MAWSGYEEFFFDATGNKPFPYQLRLVSEESMPNLLNVPTGAGKTAAITLAWLWRRIGQPDEVGRDAVPRRLVYCLPMRTLVEQTRDNVKDFLLRLSCKDQRFSKVGVHILMGGENDTEWMLFPEQEQVIIGTQDMLLSAALNRGYGMSRFRWPIAFGLVQNDCMWVMDEVQLMDVGLATSTQLDAFRRSLGTIGPTHSVWMSATLEPNWLATVDFEPMLREAKVFQLSQADKQATSLARRMSANKILHPSHLSLDEKINMETAKDIVGLHKKGTMTLIVVNRVKRAQELAELIKRVSSTEVLLVHSRYRPTDRAKLNAKLKAPLLENGKIIVATQVVEAGVDISAATMITEIAPWSSLIQRFGRCNRYGEFSHADIYWLNVADKNAAPYSQEEIEISRDQLKQLSGKNVSPDNLPQPSMRWTPEHVLRRRDIIELFDTTPDLSGNDLDISRYIREGEDLDTQVFWREWEGIRPPKDMPSPDRMELCSVHVWAVAEFLKNGSAWRWDYLSSGWINIKDSEVKPGMILLLHKDQGGYSAMSGWTGAGTDVPVIFSPEPQVAEDVTSDPLSLSSPWQTVAEHTDQVVNCLTKITSNMLLKADLQCGLDIAARWHDVGKAHQVFQQTMRSGTEEPPDQDLIWAKTPSNNLRHSQPHFRHELVSALLILQAEELNISDSTRNLAAYLAAAHHGKVRLSIRSLPEEKTPPEAAEGARIARGVWDGSLVSAGDIGDGVTISETTVSLEAMELGTDSLGRSSWLERSVKLRDEIGPFQLTFLEALLRAADMRASRQSREEGDVT